MMARINSVAGLIALVGMLSLALIGGMRYDAGGVLPSGGIIAIDTGSCPAGYAEVTAARGRSVRGTPLAGTIGGTVGSAMTDLQAVSVTPTAAWPAGVPTVAWPAGVPTVAWPAGVPVFSGSALATHQHETAAKLAGGVLWVENLGTGTSVAGDVKVTMTSDATINARILTTSTSGGTPAGTNAWPAGVPTTAWPAGVPTTAWPAGVPTVSAVATSDAAIQLTFCKRS